MQAISAIRHSQPRRRRQAGDSAIEKGRESAGRLHVRQLFMGNGGSQGMLIPDTSNWDIVRYLEVPVIVKPETVVGAPRGAVDSREWLV